MTPDLPPPSLLALLVLAYIRQTARARSAVAAPPTVAQIAASLGLPETEANEAIDALVGANMLRRAAVVGVYELTARARLAAPRASACSPAAKGENIMTADRLPH